MAKTETQAEAPKDEAPAPFKRDREANIYQRLALVMEEIRYIQKDARISFGNTNYKAVTHDAVTAAVRGHLLKHGVIAFPQDMHHEASGKGVRVRLNLRFQNIDNVQEFVDVPVFADGLDSGDKAPGKAISMAVKYGLLKGLMLETGENEESRVQPEPESDAPANSNISAKRRADVRDDDGDDPVIPVPRKSGRDGRSYDDWKGWMQAYRGAMRDASQQPEASTALAELFNANADTEARFEADPVGQDGGAQYLKDEKAKWVAIAMGEPTMEAAE